MAAEPFSTIALEHEHEHEHEDEDEDEDEDEIDSWDRDEAATEKSGSSFSPRLIAIQTGEPI